MLRQVAAMEAHRLVRVAAIVVVPVQQRARRPEASVSAYMAIAPQTSTSQALGAFALLSMLITVQGTTPKYSSIDVQHCTEVTSISLAVTQPSITAPAWPS